MKYIIRLTIALFATLAIQVSGRPTIGAFYYPWYGPDGHHWNPPGHLLTPQLGEYDSLNTAVVDQHLQWASQHHIDFLMVSYWAAAGGHANERIMHLFDRADLGPMYLAILIEPDDDLQQIIAAHESGSMNYSNYINNSINWFIMRYDIINGDHHWFSRPSYMHDPDGRKILGFFHWDQPSVMKDVISGVLSVRPDIGSSTWIWYIGSLGNKISTVRSLLYPNKGTWAPYLPLEGSGSFTTALNKYNSFKTGMSQKVITVCPSFDNTQIWGGGSTYIPRDSGYRLSQQLTDISIHAPDVNYVLVTSFNEWNENSVVEPVIGYPGGPTEGELYLDLIKGWWESW